MAKGRKRVPRNPNGPPAQAIGTSAGVAPRLELVASTRHAPSVAESIENLLANPAHYLSLHAMAVAHDAQSSESGSAPLATVFFHLQNTLDAAWAGLNALAGDLQKKMRSDACFEDRVRARSLIVAMRESMMGVMLQNARVPPRPVGPDTPDSMKVIANELARIGRHLSMAWIDIEAAETETSGMAAMLGLAAMPSTSLEAIPPLTDKGGEWISSKVAAERSNITTETLANYRHGGIKSPDDLAGIDQFGRIWRKAGANAHARYLASSVGRLTQP